MRDGSLAVSMEQVIGRQHSKGDPSNNECQAMTLDARSSLVVGINSIRRTRADGIDYFPSRYDISQRPNRCIALCY